MCHWLVGVGRRYEVKESNGGSGIRAVAVGGGRPISTQVLQRRKYVVHMADVVIGTNQFEKLNSDRILGK